MNTYTSPLISRAASAEISQIWGDDHKFKIWRNLWYHLARSQQAIGDGLITDTQLKALYKAINKPINYKKAAAYERATNHDVMAHIKLLADDAPEASKIIHLGSTSQYIVDNADAIRINESLAIILPKIASLILLITNFANNNKDVVTLGLTHFQPAQPTTVGKRAMMWAYNLSLVYADICRKQKTMYILGAKGATGTQASFVELFGSIAKAIEFDEHLCVSLGYKSHPITGQTSPRINDSILLSLMANFAVECQKICTDIRLLSGKGELYEAFSSTQVGSSAMAYKKNPLTCEKVCGLAKIMVGISISALMTTGEQWLERSLDDSITRRMNLPESFLVLDGIVESITKIFSGITVNYHVVAKNVADAMPMLITERLLMIACKNGASRQVVHDKIKQCSTQYSGSVLIKHLKKIPELYTISAREWINMVRTPELLIGAASDQVTNLAAIQANLKLSDKKFFDGPDTGD